jgi:hypothetical protein
MYWRLSPSVTACLAADRILFLDLVRDRYLTLPKVLTADFLSWTRSPADLAPQSLHEILAELGVEAGPAQDAGFPAQVLLPKASPIESRCHPAVQVRTADLLTVWRAVASAAHDVKSRPLAEVLARRPGRRDPAAGPAPDLARRVAIFRSVRPWIPVRRICLHDCLAMLDWLGRESAGVSLVLGVSVYPFAAHCWLQAGDQVLDDHPESPSRFQPILHYA